MTPILVFLDKLLSEFHTIRSLGLNSDNDVFGSHEFQRLFTRWTLSAKQALQYAGLENFLAEYETAANDSSHSVWKLTTIAGIVEGARDCFEFGLTGKLRFVLHAEMYESLTVQAKGLQEKGYKLLAAVILRIVIERWLRDEGEKAGVDDWQTAKASVVNDGLKNARVFSVPKWRQIQSLLDVGNAAAHGNDAAFSEEDVARMITFAESNCT